MHCSEPSVIMKLRGSDDSTASILRGPVLWTDAAGYTCMRHVQTSRQKPKSYLAVVTNVKSISISHMKGLQT